MLNERLKYYFMGSQLWNCVNIYVTYLVCTTFSPSEKQLLFLSEVCRH